MVSHPEYVVWFLEQQWRQMLLDPPWKNESFLKKYIPNCFYDTLLSLELACLQIGPILHF